MPATHAETAEATVNPHRLLLELSGGYCLARCLHVVANLGVADALDNAPHSVAAIASHTGSDAGALARVLRLLAAYDVFSLDDGFVSHTPASRLLRSDHPQSMRPFAQMFGLPVNWAALGELEHSVRSGQPAVTRVHPGSYWDYLADHPHDSEIFNSAMAAKSHGQVASVMASFDFSGFREIGDIGGGRGHLLQAVLEVVPAARGVLFDLPHVAAEAAGIATDRLTIQSGDFFRDDLPACDLYLLMEVIHDWGDAEAIAILKAVRRAALPGATLLLIEGVLDDRPGPARPGPRCSISTCWPCLAGSSGQRCSIRIFSIRPASASSVISSARAAPRSSRRRFSSHPGLPDAPRRHILAGATTAGAADLRVIRADIRCRFRP